MELSDASSIDSTVAFMSENVTLLLLCHSSNAISMSWIVLYLWTHKAFTKYYSWCVGRGNPYWNGDNLWSEGLDVVVGYLTGHNNLRAVIVSAEVGVCEIGPTIVDHCHTRQQKSGHLVIETLWYTVWTLYKCPKTNIINSFDEKCSRSHGRRCSWWKQGVSTNRQLQISVRVFINPPCYTVVLQRHLLQELEINIKTKTEAVERKFARDGTSDIWLDDLRICLSCNDTKHVA